jgi:hypothetical protein
MRLANPKVSWTEISRCPDDKQAEEAAEEAACEPSRCGHLLALSEHLA